jgi:hypothetical protein
MAVEKLSRVKLIEGLGAQRQIIHALHPALSKLILTLRISPNANRKKDNAAVG